MNRLHVPYILKKHRGMILVVVRALAWPYSQVLQPGNKAYRRHSYVAVECLGCWVMAVCCSHCGMCRGCSNGDILVNLEGLHEGLGG